MRLAAFALVALFPFLAFANELPLSAAASSEAAAPVAPVPDAGKIGAAMGGDALPCGQAPSITIVDVSEGLGGSAMADADGYADKLAELPAKAKETVKALNESYPVGEDVIKRNYFVVVCQRLKEKSVALETLKPALASLAEALGLPQPAAAETVPNQPASDQPPAASAPPAPSGDKIAAAPEPSASAVEPKAPEAAPIAPAPTTLPNAPTDIQPPSTPAEAAAPAPVARPEMVGRPSADTKVEQAPAGVPADPAAIAQKSEAQPTAGQAVAQDTPQPDAPGTEQPAAPETSTMAQGEGPAGQPKVGSEPVQSSPGSVEDPAVMKTPAPPVAAEAPAAQSSAPQPPAGEAPAAPAASQPSSAPSSPPVVAEAPAPSSSPAPAESTPPAAPSSPPVVAEAPAPSSPPAPTESTPAVAPPSPPAVAEAPAPSTPAPAESTPPAAPSSLPVVAEAPAPSTPASAESTPAAAPSSPPVVAEAPAPSSPPALAESTPPTAPPSPPAVAEAPAPSTPAPAESTPPAVPPSQPVVAEAPAPSAPVAAPPPTAEVATTPSPQARSAPAAPGQLGEDECRAIGVLNNCSDLNSVLGRLLQKPLEYNHPKTMYLGRKTEIGLVLRSDWQGKDMPAEVADEIKKLPGEVQQGLTKITRVMSAELSGRDFEVAPTGRQERTVVLPNPVSWNWQVKPSESGPGRTLKLQLYAHIEGPDGAMPPILIKTLDAAIDVDVKTWDWLLAQVRGLEPIYVIIAALLGLFAAIVTYMFTRKPEGVGPRGSSRPGGPVIGDLDQSGGSGKPPSRGDEA